jgi:DNA-binding transcriptional ArsR family regulator
MQAVRHEPEKRVTPVVLRSQLNAVLDVEQSLLSHHLKVLREEGFVQATRDGKAVLYTLTPEVQRANSGKAIDLGCCLLCFD